MTKYLFKQAGSRVWRGRYCLEGEKQLHDVSLGTSDKSVAEQTLLELVRDAERERAGIVAPKRMRAAAQERLADHLAAYVRELGELGRNDVYVYNVHRLGARLFKECGWEFPKDVTAESFRAWRGQQQKAAKTLNEYLAVASGLFNWLVGAGRLAVNPLAGVQWIDMRGKAARVRRALTDAESVRLLAAAGEWRPVYLLALLTGLRRNELASLVWGDVHLEESPRPCLWLRAAITKNRRDDRTWLHPEAVEVLRTLQAAGTSNEARVFPKMPRMDHHLTILKAAGIAYKDEHGRQADFHALRHTFNTRMARLGIPDALRQAAMRHRTAALTVGQYTDQTGLGTGEMISAMPWLGSAPSQVASHKFGAAGPSVASAGSTSFPVDATESIASITESHVLALAGAGGHETVFAASLGLSPTQ